MIRIATSADLPRIVEMAEKFFRQTKMYSVTGFDEESIKKTFSFLDGEKGVCYVLEIDGHVVGMVGALAYEFYMNLSIRIGQELFWWVDDDHRGSSGSIKMMKAIEEWAKKAGCVSFAMIALDGIDHEKVCSIYSRLGYSKSEYVYVKEL